MGYAILACCCEENYLHNVRRAINDIKMNIEETKPKIMSNINHLLRYDKTKLTNKMFEDFKFRLSKIKVGNYKHLGYHRWEFYMGSYYLEDILAPLTEIYEYKFDSASITDVKKYLLKLAKKYICEAEDEFIFDTFDYHINKYGKLNNEDISFGIRLIAETSYEVKTENNDLLDFISK